LKTKTAVVQGPVNLESDVLSGSYADLFPLHLVKISLCIFFLAIKTRLFQGSSGYWFAD
jgi:hypothetical protein